MTGHNFSDPRLSFLVFRSRSGSTFFGDRLSRHPEVLVTPESNVVPRLVEYFKESPRKDCRKDKLVEYIYNEQKFREWGLPREMLANEFNQLEEADWPTIFFACCKAYRDWQKPEAKVVVFKKSGWYYKNIDLLLETYPGSMGMWIIRDPRAVYNSACKALHSEKKKPMADNIFENAFGWRDFAKRLSKAKDKWRGRVLTVLYESFLSDVSGTLNYIWQRLGLQILNNIELNELVEQPGYSHLVTSSTSHLHCNVTQGPIFERAEKWKDELPRWRSTLIRLICKKDMRIHGYR
ncbi:MAG: sulfotransferase [Desulfatiglandales bacterium]